MGTLPPAELAPASAWRLVSLQATCSGTASYRTAAAGGRATLCPRLCPRLVPRVPQAQRELGLSVTPVRQTLVDMAVTLVQLGTARPKLRGGQ